MVRTHLLAASMALGLISLGAVTERTWLWVTAALVGLVAVMLLPRLLATLCGNWSALPMFATLVLLEMTVGWLHLLGSSTAGSVALVAEGLAMAWWAVTAARSLSQPILTGVERTDYEFGATSPSPAPKPAPQSGCRPESSRQPRCREPRGRPIGDRTQLRTSSLAVSSTAGGPLTIRVLTTDSRQGSRSSAIFSFGPMRATSSTMAVGTAATAARLSPAR